MTPTIRTFDELDLWRRPPGSLDPWVRWVIAGAAVITLVALGLSSAMARRVSRRRFAGACTGTVVSAGPDDDPIVAWVEVASWLRGPRMWIRPFVVRTPAADIPVSRAGKLVVPIPELTTRLHTGESVAVLRAGEPVQVGGLIDAPRGGHPFRSSPLPLPGPDGVFVRRADDLTEVEPGLVNDALALWRPCVSYLLIVTAVAAAGLSAMLY